MPITVSGTQITFNDATTQSTAGITSAVTSLNGQTGAITNTTLANIGSYIVALARTTAAASYSRGSTISGSNLRYATTYGTNGGTFAVGSGGGEPNSSGANTTNPSLSGTWRAMGTSGAGSAGKDGIWSIAQTLNLWVRVS